MTTDREIKPIAIPGIHEKFIDYLMQGLSDKDLKIIDIGAGHGYTVKKLHEKGYDVAAADLFPENFYYDPVECKKADVTRELPFDDESFDVVIAVEVMEHVHDHQLFFREVYRILKPGGQFFYTTPNILSLKSRVRFLLSGFYYSFKPLKHEISDGLQHVSSLTVDQYKNLAVRAHFFNDMEVRVDKKQSTSNALLFLAPFIWLYCKLKKIEYKLHNQTRLLTGRVIFIKVQK